MSEKAPINRLNIITLGIVLVSVVAMVIYLYRYNHLFAYVRSAELVYNYNGMKDAHATYKAQSSTWQSNIDTLKMQYQRCLADYQATYKTLSETERAEKQATVKKLEDNLKSYSSVIHDQAQEKEKEMTEAVLNQINSYVEEYAKKKGYDFVIGSNNGTLLYANKAYDITDEVLEALNKDYKIMPQESSKGSMPKSADSK